MIFNIILTFYSYSYNFFIYFLLLFLKDFVVKIINFYPYLKLILSKAVSVKRNYWLSKKSNFKLILLMIIYHYFSKQISLKYIPENYWNCLLILTASISFINVCLNLNALILVLMKVKFIVKSGQYFNWIMIMYLPIYYYMMVNLMMFMHFNHLKSVIMVSLSIVLMGNN